MVKIISTIFTLIALLNILFFNNIVFGRLKPLLINELIKKLSATPILEENFGRHKR